MNKKVLLSVAATAALIMTNPGMNKADAASQGEKVVYYQSSNLDQQQINSLINKYLQDFQFKFNNIQSPQPTNVQENQKPNQVQQPPVQQQPAPSQPTASVPAPAENQQTVSQVSAFEQKVVELTNQERAKYGVPALKLDVELSKVARTKSSDMKSKGYFAHNSPTYGSPFDMMKQFGITYRSAGENIAMGQRTPEEVVKAWMNSEGHRKNILNSSFTHIGVGYVGEGNYWTQMFIGK
jgi:uncharacterized YkwD family protein